MMVELGSLVARFGGEQVGNSRDVVGVTLDSRDVEAGSLFCALQGQATDGRHFLDNAFARGASAVLTEARAGDQALLKQLSAEQVVWLHPEARRVAGLAADQVYGHPSRAMEVIGVTGTNGKTSVAFMVAQLAAEALRRPSIFGTVEHRVWGQAPVRATTTTPDAPTLHRLMHAAGQAGGDMAVLEVSSHAIDQERIAGIDFDVCIFTNMSRDHLYYHGSMEAYAETKLRLFRNLGKGKQAVINLDDAYGARFAEAARASGAQVTTYSIGSRADLMATQCDVGPNGTQIVLQGMGLQQSGFYFPLRGRHNIENALAALAAMLLLEASPAALATGLATISPAPGRLEAVDPEGEAARGFAVFVDFAHTPDALRVAQQAAREATRVGGRLIVVFGCGGDRDRGKRPYMGAAVKSLADIAVLTSDNPRSENPDAILDEIEIGFQGAVGHAELWREVDRKRAIQRAVDAARPGDVVLVAGKGHETVQIIGEERRPFDDRLVALELLK